MSQDLPVTSYALLGLLTFGDALTGYELKQRADATLRFYWVSPAMSQVYCELARLTDAGLVAAGGVGRGTTYTISDAGRRALETLAARHPGRLPRLQAPGGAAADDRPPDRRRHAPHHARATRRARWRRSAGATCARCGPACAARDAPGEAFHHPSLVADWGLDTSTARAVSPAT